MRFNTHSSLAGLHAVLSPSDYHWVNYTEDKMERVFHARTAARLGTEMHEFAHRAIKLGVKLPSSRRTINLYVNDGIGFKMTPEQVLFYSVNCFGTADLIGFRDNFLRIHDLKTGVTEASFHQLEVYAALFCLEYKYKPNQIETELRIYQNDEVRVFVPDPDTIFHIIDKIITFNKAIDRWKEEVPF